MRPKIYIAMKKYLKIATIKYVTWSYIYVFNVSCRFSPMPDRPEALDLSVPGPTLGAESNFLHMHIFLWCPELWEKFIVVHSGNGLGYWQAHFTSIKVIMNRIGITNLIIFFLWVIIHVDISRRRPPSSLLRRPRFTAAQERAEWMSIHTGHLSAHIKPAIKVNISNTKPN